jgi:DNA helicase-2/ATP-dependent DNA helicase PcrA
VAEQVLHHREGGLTLKSQAVLFRTASHSAPLEIELTRRNIPFVKYGGLKFLEAAHVKDVLSVLRWAENPRNRIAGFRVIQLLPGAGPATAARVLDAMAEAADPIAALLAYEPPARLAGDWSTLMALMQTLRVPKDSLEWAGELEAVGAWYSPHMERLHDDAAVRQGDLDQLARMAATYATRERFLTEMTLDPPELTSDESGDPYRDEDYLILSTIHSSKGQEWKAVYVLNAVDGCMPADLGAGSHEELEEERRLLYVAMTRAREHLDILVPQRFYVTQQTPNGDRHIYASRTRFIPPALLPLFEACAWPEPEPGADPAAEARAAAKVDLSKKMRGYWKK